MQDRQKVLVIRSPASLFPSGTADSQDFSKWPVSKPTAMFLCSQDDSFTLCHPSFHSMRFLVQCLSLNAFA